jgi:hypothetical protein
MRRSGMNMGMVRSKSCKLTAKAKAKAMKMKHNLSDDHIKVLKKIDEVERAEMFDFREIEDINGLLSKLIPDYVCKVKDKFVLMAAGRKIVDELTSIEDD